jgi:hypothetical protein
MKAPARRRSERKILTNGDFQAAGDLGLSLRFVAEMSQDGQKRPHLLR